MSEKEHDCPTCADWNPTDYCTAPIHGGTPCENWRPREDKTDRTDRTNEGETED